MITKRRPRNAYKSIRDPRSIRKAMGEFDELGREQFLAKYGFRRARAYFLVYEGKTYDSKAIVGAAYGYEFPGQEPLRWNELHGGKRTVQRKLEELGFEVRILPRSIGT